MGGTSWSDSAYTSSVSAKAARGYSAFEYDDKIKRGEVARGVHETLDPKKMKAGKRECRDSAEHPEAKPIYVGLDATGSMQQVPRLIQEKFPKLMGLIARGGYVDHPSICVSVIGDSHYDDAPLQVGQFEAGVEIDNDITNMYLEGGGGGNSFESYELALYFLAYMVEADEFDKRNGKGYAFIICDESLTPTIKASEVEKVFGVKLQGDLDTEEVVELVKQKWNLYCIVPKMTAHFGSSAMKTLWKKVLGQNLILLDDPTMISETIAATIAANSGFDVDSIEQDLITAGTSSASAKSVSTAISNVVGGGMTKLAGSGLTTLQSSVTLADIISSGGAFPTRSFGKPTENF